VTSGIEQQDAVAVQGRMWPDRRRLPAFDLDADVVLAEALRLPASAWVPHFHHAIYDGDWSGVALRSVGGDPHRIYATDPTVDPATGWQPTSWLAACPITGAMLETLPFPVTSVRFLRLGPGSEIRTHNDPGLGAPHGEVRLHIALSTHEGVTFGLAGEPVDLRLGECWYLDLDQPHTAANRGALPRIHLVIDGLVDDTLAAMIATAPSG
jgi:hypothetical protein